MKIVWVYEDCMGIEDCMGVENCMNSRNSIHTTKVAKNEMHLLSPRNTNLSEEIVVGEEEHF